MSDCHWTDRAHIDYMGYKMRTEDWSVTAWQRCGAPSHNPSPHSSCVHQYVCCHLASHCQHQM